MAGTERLDPEQLRQLSALLDQALTLDAADRQAWRVALPPSLHPLLPRLDALLNRAAMSTDSFMRRPISVPADGLQAGEDQPGDVVGPYRLLRELGSGGMATVWLADRQDGVFQRQVALKLPRLGWAPGLADRMKRECDILATLEHRHIARLYDAGIASAGRPYLAMEYVNGRPIDEFARASALSIEARLRLILQVAEAVAYAHGRLVVHRDLKPSNILVTASSEVRLLDFGVARLLSSEAADGPLTQFAGQAFTREYASPEQIDGLQLTVATDVYSLGIVLYELLAGQRPYTMRLPRHSELDEALIGDDPPLASRRAADGAIARALKGDLDNILAKALRRKPERRYQSIESFAADIERYLANEPVHARAPSLRYRAGKFLRRHRASLAAAGVTSTAVLVGFGTALWQAQEARRQAETTRAVQELSQTAVDFTGGVLVDVTRSGEPMSILAVAERSSAVVEKESGVTALERAVAAEHAAAWFSAIDRFDRGEQVLSRALAQLPAGFDPTALRNLRCQRAAMRATLGRIEDARAELDEVISASATDPHSAWNCLQRRTRVALQLGDAQGALRYAQAALAQFDQSGNRSDLRRALLLAGEGFALVISGEPARATARYEAAVRLLRDSGNGESGQAAGVLQDWAVGLRSAGDPRAALARFDQALDIEQRQSVTGEASATVHGNRAHALRVLARHDDAALGFSRALEIARRNRNANQELFALSGLALVALARRQHVEARTLVEQGEQMLARGDVAAEGAPARWLQLARARIARQQGRLDDADAVLAGIEAMYSRRQARTGALAEVLVDHCGVALARGRPAEATRYASEAVVVARAAQGDRAHSLLTGQAMLALAQARAAQHDLLRARDVLQQAMSHLEAMAGGDHPDLRTAQALAEAVKSPT